MNFSIRDLKGIGPRKEALFARLHLATVSDLLQYPMNLKRKAFRLQMTVRKGDHEAALNDYNVLKEAIEEFRLQLERR